MITDVDLDILIVATVISFIKDMTYQGCQSARKIAQISDIPELQRKPSTPQLRRAQH